MLIAVLGCCRALSVGPIRGVNIGGWLVLESWITPTLYRDNNVTVSSPLAPGAPPSNGKGEWGFCAKLGKTNCSLALQKHWETWVTYEDIKALADAGVNWLRWDISFDCFLALFFPFFVFFPFPPNFPPVYPSAIGSSTLSHLNHLWKEGCFTFSVC